MVHRRIVFHGKQQAALETFELPQVAAGQVLVRVRQSLMSTGTENIVYNRLFDAGTHWDGWVQYPFYPGYCCVGVVEQLGEGVSTLSVGQRVVVRRGHATGHVVPAENCRVIPEGVSDDAAVFFALGKITLIGARAAEIRATDCVAVLGAGPIGQLATRWALALGAKTVVTIDPAEPRMKFLQPVHAVGIPLPAGEAEARLKAACGGELPRIVIDSTGHWKVFAAAQALVARFGRIVLLGTTGTPTENRLTDRFVPQGLSLVGAHDGHAASVAEETRDAAYLFELIRTKRFSVDGLITHRFAAAKFQDAYTLANTDRDHTMGLVFDFSNA